MGPVTVNTEASPVNPTADADIVAVPAVVAVNVVVALPAVAVTTGPGLKLPDTPLTENVTAFVALGTTFPFASSICTEYVTGAPVWALPVCGVITI